MFGSSSLRFLALFFASVLALSACGSDSDANVSAADDAVEDASTGGEDGEASDDEASDDEASDDVLDELSESTTSTTSTEAPETTTSTSTTTTEAPETTTTEAPETTTTSTTTTTEAPETTTTSTTTTSTEAPPPAIDGSVLYASNCSRCHQADGSGSRGPNIQGRTDTGPIETIIANGRGGMPAFPNLSDAEVAAIATHVVSAF